MEKVSSIFNSKIFISSIKNLFQVLLMVLILDILFGVIINSYGPKDIPLQLADNVPEDLEDTQHKPNLEKTGVHKSHGEKPFGSPICHVQWQ